MQRVLRLLLKISDADRMFLEEAKICANLSGVNTDSNDHVGGIRS